MKETCLADKGILFGFLLKIKVKWNIVQAKRKGLIFSLIKHVRKIAEVNLVLFPLF